MTSRELRWTRSSRARAAGAGLALLLGAALAGVPAGAERSAPALYQWTDERGNVRYTPDPDRVPSSQRGTLLRLEPGMPPPAQPGPSPAPPAVISPAATAPDAARAPAAASASAATPGPASAVSATPRGETLPAPEAPPAAAAGDAAREQQLAAAIAEDEAALEALISAPIAEGDAPLADSAQLREIARRLPGLQAELSALRERRSPPAGP
jgi:hypothetical protein